jgi:hypothetical protein
MNGPPALNAEPVPLGATLQTLGADTSDYTAALEKMWMPAAGDRPESPPLMKDRPASFLLVSPAPEGRMDFTKSRLASVWLDGQEVEMK